MELRREFLPPSMISGIRPLSWAKTSSAVDGLCPPEMLAEVTAIGPAARSRARATSWSGTRTPTVDVAETASGRVWLFGDDAGQRSRPEAGGEFVGGLWDVDSNFFQIICIGNQNGDRLFDGTVFGNVDRLDRPAIECQTADAVNRVGGERDKTAGLQDVKGEGSAFRDVD